VWIRSSAPAPFTRTWSRSRFEAPKPPEPPPPPPLRLTPTPTPAPARTPAPAPPIEAIRPPAEIPRTIPPRCAHADTPRQECAAAGRLIARKSIQKARPRPPRLRHAFEPPKPAPTPPQQAANEKALEKASKRPRPPLPTAHALTKPHSRPPIAVPPPIPIRVRASPQPQPRRRRSRPSPLRRTSPAAAAVPRSRADANSPQMLATSPIRRTRTTCARRYNSCGSRASCKAPVPRNVLCLRSVTSERDDRARRPAAHVVHHALESASRTWIARGSGVRRVRPTTPLPTSSKAPAPPSTPACPRSPGERVRYPHRERASSRPPRQSKLRPSWLKPVATAAAAAIAEGSQATERRAGCADYLRYVDGEGGGPGDMRIMTRS